jgi:hypothetical protein
VRSASSEFRNNIIAGVSASGYAVGSGGTGNVFEYDLLYDTPSGDRDCAVRWNSSFDPNGQPTGGTCYSTLAAFRTAQGKETHGLEGNPQFVASAASPLNLHIQSSSAARDVGTTISDFSTDYDGQTRSGTWDIGADEYGGGAGPNPPQLLEVVPASGQ